MPGLAVEARVGNATRTAVTRDDGSFRVALAGDELDEAFVLVELVVRRGAMVAGLERTLRLPVERATVLTVAPLAPIVPGERMALEAWLRRADGAPVADAPLVVSLRNATLGTARTDATGLAAKTLGVPPMPSGDALLRLDYEGAPGLAPASLEVPVAVRGRVALDVAVHRTGPSMEVVLRLTDAGGRGVTNATLLVAVPGYETPLQVATGPDGAARIAALRAADQGTILARSIADGHFLAAEGSTDLRPTALTLAPAAGLGLLVAAAIGLLAVAGALIWGARHMRRGLAVELGATMAEAERALRGPDPHVAVALQAYAALVGVLEDRGLLRASHATAREAQRVLRDTFALPERDLETVIATFEDARYAAAAPGRAQAQAAADALARLQARLREVAA